MGGDSEGDPTMVVDTEGKTLESLADIIALLSNQVIKTKDLSFIDNIENIQNEYIPELISIVREGVFEDKNTKVNISKELKDALIKLIKKKIKLP